MSVFLQIYKLISVTFSGSFFLGLEATSLGYSFKFQ